MTQLRFHPGSISNYFDAVLSGIGHRGSSFSDIDAVSHDSRTKRFLVQEFKREGEPRDKAQHWMLCGLAEIPKHFTVWVIEKRADGCIGFAAVQPFQELQFEYLTVEEYQERFRAWWDNQRPKVAPSSLAVDTAPRPVLAAPLMDTDIKWD